LGFEQIKEKRQGEKEPKQDEGASKGDESEKLLFGTMLKKMSVKFFLTCKKKEISKGCRE